MAVHCVNHNPVDKKLNKLFIAFLNWIIVYVHALKGNTC